MEEEGISGGINSEGFCKPTMKLFLDQYDKLKSLEKEL